MNKENSEKKTIEDILEFYKNWDSQKSPLLLNIEEYKKKQKN